MQRFWRAGPASKFAIRLAVVLTASALVSTGAGAQATVDYATRTASAVATATVPATPGQITYSSATLHGWINAADLTPEQLTHVVYRFEFAVSAGAFGITDPTACCLAAGASIWIKGFTDDTAIWTDGLENGYGNDFFGWEKGWGGPYDIPWDFVTDHYSVYLNADVPLAGQGAGATGSATARATLIGAYLLNGDGTIARAATFDGVTGYGTFGTLPEPATSALLAPGLLAIAPFGRRRRASPMS